MSVRIPTRHFSYASPSCCVLGPGTSFLTFSTARSPFSSHLANAYRVPQTPILILTRRLQTQPSKTTPAKTPLPPPNNAPKPQVKLNPGPIKPPKTLPATPPPAVAASRTPPPTAQTVDRVSLKNLKETTAKDIADAESHGILTPPPEGAGWAKSTLHKAIQIAVR